MGSVMASTRGNFLKAREYFCILLSFLELSLVRQPPTRFICSSPFSVSKKKMPTKNLDWEFRETVGLFGCKLLFILALKIGTTSWKTPCTKKEWVFLGIRYFGGAPVVKMPFAWYHICFTVNYLPSKDADRSATSLRILMRTKTSGKSTSMASWTSRSPRNSSQRLGQKF